MADISLSKTACADAGDCKELPIENNPCPCDQFDLEDILIFGVSNTMIVVGGTDAGNVNWQQFRGDLEQPQLKASQPSIPTTGVCAGAVPAQGVFTIQLSNGSVSYSPGTGEIPVPGAAAVKYAACFQVMLDGCPCGTTFWLCATVNPAVDPCPQSADPVSVPATCTPEEPLTTTTLATILASQTDWTLANATITDVQPGGINPGTLANIAFNTTQFTYFPADGEEGETLTFNVTVTEGQCAKTIVVSLQYDQFCDIFELEDVSITLNV